MALKAAGQPCTVIYVTHDQVEAMTMGERICVLKEGRIQQFDTPSKLYNAPANTFVASFIGSPEMNMLDATLTVAGAVQKRAAHRRAAFHPVFRAGAMSAGPAPENVLVNASDAGRRALARQRAEPHRIHGQRGCSPSSFKVGAPRSRAGCRPTRAGEARDAEARRPCAHRPAASRRRTGSTPRAATTSNHPTEPPQQRQESA